MKLIVLFVLFGCLPCCIGQIKRLSADGTVLENDNDDIIGNNDQLICEEYNPKNCDPSKRPDCPYESVCQKPANGARRSCYVVWKNMTSRTGEHMIEYLLKGCWESQVGSGQNCDQSKCTSTDQPGNKESPMFCCCMSPLCNSKAIFKSKLVSVDHTTIPPSVERPTNQVLTGILYVFLPICFLALVIFFSYYIYRRHRAMELNKRNIETAQNPVANGVAGVASGPLRPIQLIELTARGRFGQVWKGQLSDQMVAVKKFPPQDADSWMQEQDIYNVSGMKSHPNILPFIGTEIRGTGLQIEYWLITEFMELGSLTDYLKGHTLSQRQMLYMIQGMLRGLAFLHEEMTSRDDSVQKATIVHRDFKSRNVLLRRDLTPCVGDYGLALKCEHGRTPQDTHGQVGTRRYMSPEVLEGATEFSAFAFRQIDVYAGALVLWEILSRTKIITDEEPTEYKLPFEEEVGMHPTLSDMQQWVVQNKQRPHIQSKWMKDPQVSVICHTIEEMWDTEPEARITAGCAYERVQSLSIPGVVESLRNLQEQNWSGENNSTEIVAMSSLPKQTNGQPELSPLISSYAPSAVAATETV